MTRLAVTPSGIALLSFDLRCVIEKTGGVTGVRTDQTGARIPPVPIAGCRESACRVGHDLHRSQPQQAVHPRKGRLSRLPCNKCQSQRLSGLAPRSTKRTCSSGPIPRFRREQLRDRCSVARGRRHVAHVSETIIAADLARGLFAFTRIGIFLVNVRFAPILLI
jgi:hypothetical protein